jgi:hypothetical protein
MGTARDLYLDLMSTSLADWLDDQFDAPVRVERRDWPARAHTMIGLKRLAKTCGSASSASWRTALPAI